FIEGIEVIRLLRERIALRIADAVERDAIERLRLDRIGIVRSDEERHVRRGIDERASADLADDGRARAARGGDLVDVERAVPAGLPRQRIDRLVEAELERRRARN